MQLPESDITRIVEAVVDVLTSSTTDARTDTADSTERLVLRTSTVTLETLRGRLDGVRQLIVDGRAVVTPSARDLLLQRNIALLRSADGRGAGKSEKTTYDDCEIRRVVLVRHGERGGMSDSLLRALLGGRVEPIDRAMPCVFRAVQWIVEQLEQPATLAVMTTDHPDVALCAANRRVELRAVQAEQPGRVLPAVQAVGANLLILPAGAIAMPGFRSALRHYVEAGPWECPESLAELNKE